LVTQYCGNGALSDLDSGITAFNLFNTKFLEGLHPSHEHRVAGYQHRRRGHNAVLNFPDKRHPQRWEPRYNRCPTRSGW